MTQPAEPDLYGWTPDTSVAGAGWEEATPEVKAAAQLWAVGVLWALSGRRFALHPHRIAPYLAPRFPNAYQRRVRAGNGGMALAGLAVNYATGVATVGGSGPARTVRLPGPVHEVTQVQVDGQVLAVEAWTLDPDGTLVRTDGDGWPVGQDVYAPTPRWLVDYVLGVPVPDAGNVAAGRYAGELVRASTGAACALPTRARSITRPGLTIEMPDVDALTENGRTGSPQVDAWLATVNPGGLTAGATVYSPDVAGHRFLS